MDEILVPASVLAACFELTEARIRQLVKEGVIPRAKRGLYPLIAAVRGYLAFKRREFEQRQSASDPVRAKLLDARARSAEADADLKLGIAIRRDEALSVTQACVGVIVTRLEGLGGRLATELATMQDPALIAERIKRETREIRAAAVRELGSLGPKEPLHPRPPTAT